MNFALMPPIPVTGAVWYRMTDCRTAPPLDEWDNPVGSGSSHVTITEYDVVRVTPKGVWLIDKWHIGPPRFVLREARKRWACPTEEEAIASFLARKQRQLRILESQAHHVRLVMREAERRQEETRREHPEGLATAPCHPDTGLAAPGDDSNLPTDTAEGNPK